MDTRSLKRLKKNSRKKGSILIYVMTIFAVLMIMGSTLLMLITQNYKNRKYYATSRLNEYYSESGIEEAYGIVKEYVQNAYDYSMEKTDIEIESLKEDEYSRLEEIEEKRLKGEDVSGDISNLKVYDENGELDREKLKEEQNRVFRTYFGEYFNKNYNGEMNLKYMLDDLENNVYLGDGSDRVEIQVTNKSELVCFISGMKVKLESKFKREDIEKVIKADLSMTVPDYDSKLLFPTKFQVVSLSPVMDKVIVVDGSVNIYGALQIKGDFYSKGNNGLNGKPEGAIFLKDKDAKFKVAEGSVTAAEGVVYDYSYSYNRENPHMQGALIEIADRSLYTKNISMKKDSEGARLLVDGNVYVKDDLQIESNHAYVDVGKYYGVSDGSDSDGNKIDNSSSIIINSRDFGPGETNIKMNSLILAGTSYITGLKNPAETGEYSYQTGESISVKGNYVAYNEDFINSHIINTQKYGEKDLKYELRRSLLSPLSLGTHYDLYTRWFAIYNDNSEKKLLVDMKYELKRKYPQGEKGRIHGRTEIFSLGEKILINEDLYNILNGEEEIQVDILREDESFIDTISMRKIENDLEGYLYNDGTDNFLRVDLTPRGQADQSLMGVIKFKTDMNENVSEMKNFHEMVQVSNSLGVGDQVQVELYNRFNENFAQRNINLKDYDEYLMNVDGRDKSKIFKAWYEDNSSTGKIKGQEGIEIENAASGIYTGSIIFKDINGVNRIAEENYYENSSVNGKKIGHRLDTLKDRLFYMDVYEKKYQGDIDNPFMEGEILRDIDEIYYEDYYNEVVASGKSPRNTKDYVLEPKTFIDVSGVTSNNVDRLKDTGLYINYNSNGVLLTNTTSNEFDGRNFNGDVLKIKNSDRGIIICKKDIYIKGNFEFNGLLIAMGDIYVEKGTECSFIYDQSIVASVLAEEHGVLKDVFIENMNYRGDKVRVISYDEIVSNDSSVPLNIEKWVVVR